jgi:hypothetical protein
MGDHRSRPPDDPRVGLLVGIARIILAVAVLIRVLVYH